MSVNRDFLLDEVRNGFYIPASIKQCWAVELDILSEIDSLCQKYDIKYYAEYGTLLGAVRHGGFIPWDDDLDIGMFRTDLDRFLSVANELPDGYNVHCYKNRPDYDQFIYNVVNTNHINLDPSFLNTFHGMPYICGVDIFVMDNVSDDEVEEKKRCTLTNYIIQIADEIFAGNIDAKEISIIMNNIEKLANVTVPTSLYNSYFIGNVDLRIHLYSIAENLFTKFNNVKTSCICQIMPWGLNGVRHYPREYYNELVRIPFENTTIPVPSRYNSMLINRYGDYMKLVKNQGAHDYPCIAIQRDNLKEQIVNNMGIDAYNTVFPSYKYTPINSEIRHSDTSANQSNNVIVFLPFCDKYWNMMSDEYQKCVDDESYEVYVVPIPYYFKDYATKELLDEQYCIDLYPEDIELYDWTMFDIATIHPSKIYIQFPYDQYNPVISIHPNFYSATLKKYTDELIYIPWFQVDDFDISEERSYMNMNEYCLMPGVVNADKILLNSEKIREMYIRKLSKWSDFESNYSNRIVVTPYKETVFYTKDHLVIMYYIGLSQIIENGATMIKKINQTIAIIRKNKKLSLYLKVDNTFEESLKILDNYLFTSFTDAINPIKDDPDWIYDNTTYNSAAVEYCDAFYGDAGHLADMFRQAQKPYLIQDPTI